MPSAETGLQNRVEFQAGWETQPQCRDGTRDYRIEKTNLNQPFFDTTSPATYTGRPIDAQAGVQPSQPRWRLSNPLGRIVGPIHGFPGSRSIAT